MFAASRVGGIPRCDHRIVEFALSLPTPFKLHRGRHKRVLKELLRRHLPPPLVDRPKMGFSVPMNRWLRGELRPWAAELLAGAREPFEPAVLQALWQALWQEHLQGRCDHTERLRRALSLLQFLRCRSAP